MNQSSASTPFLDALLEQRRFKAGTKPPPIEPVYWLNDTVICTPGNLATIVAAPKAGKTAAIGAMIASVIKRDDVNPDTLGFSSHNPASRALLHFDTEQSQHHHWGVVELALVRAGIDEPPSWFSSYWLLGIAPQTVWKLIQIEVHRAAQKFGGVHSILIDGYGDLVVDVNDPKECNGLIAGLHSTAIQLSCPIVGVLHLNPGTEKSRGHLGSHLERKSETNLRLDKVEHITEIWSDKQRHEPIPKGTGPKFRWDDSSGRHVSVASDHESIRSDRLETARHCADDVFADRAAMRYVDIRSAIIEQLKVSGATAERRIKDWQRLGVIEKGDGSLWARNGIA